MNDFLFFILEDGTIKRINVSPDTLQKIVTLFTAHLSKFISDDITPIFFDGRFKPDEGQVLYANLSLSDEFSKIPDNTIEYDIVNLPDDSVKTLALYHDGDYFFQCFAKHYVLKQRNIVLQKVSNNNYQQFQDKSAFNVEDNVHGVYHDGNFYFLSYSQAKQIFDLSFFYQEATDKDITDTIGHDLFLGSDLEWFKNNSDSVIRKQITILKKSDLLDTIDVGNRDFKKWAKKPI